MLYKNLGNTRLSVSIIGFGASPLGDVFGIVTPADGRRAVQSSIDAGINFFDVSPYYGIGMAEQRLGEALKGHRQKVILATKCGRYGADSFDFSARRIKASIEESLERLQTDYVDLLQAHDIEFGHVDQILNETIPALRELQAEGKARFVGITGYSLRLLGAVAACRSVDTVLSYCRYNLMTQDLDRTLRPVTQSKGIGLINASPLHMGILTDGGAPAWHPAPAEVKEAGKRVVSLCRERGYDASAVALRYCLEYPYMCSTVVGMSTTTQLEANLTALNLELDPELLRSVKQVIAPVKDTVWSSGLPENDDSVFQNGLCIGASE